MAHKSMFCGVECNWPRVTYSVACTCRISAHQKWCTNLHSHVLNINKSAWENSYQVVEEYSWNTTSLFQFSQDLWSLSFCKPMLNIIALCLWFLLIGSLMLCPKVFSHVNFNSLHKTIEDSVNWSWLSFC